MVDAIHYARHALVLHHSLRVRIEGQEFAKRCAVLR
jgi:hypothetical protein